MNLKKISIHLFLASLLAFFFFVGCGEEGSVTTSSGSGSDVSLNGTVTTPSTTSKSVSIGPLTEGLDDSAQIEVADGESGLSLSKSAGGSHSDVSDEPTQVIVSKAISNTFCDEGSCTVQKLDGTVVDSCLIRAGALQGCNMKAEDCSSNSMIEIVCDACGTKVSHVIDCTGFKNGQAASVGQTNDSTTLADTLLHTGADSNSSPENKTGSLKSAVSGGVVKLQALRTLEKQLGLSGSAGSEDGKSSLIAMKKAISAGMAEGKVKDFATMLKAFQGDSTTLSILKGLDSDLANVNLTDAAATALQTPATVLNYLKDATTAGKWNSPAAYEALAKNIGAFVLGELQAVAITPANLRNLLKTYADDAASGVADPYAKMIEGAKSFGPCMAQWGTSLMTSGQGSAQAALFKNMSFSGLSTAAMTNLGKDVFAQGFAATTTAMENDIRGDPSSYATLLTSKPGALFTGGNALAVQRLNQGMTGSFTGITAGCSVNADCPASTPNCAAAQGWCVANASGTANGSGVPGATCTNNNDCGSGSCVGSTCSFPSGDLASKRGYGQTCSDANPCMDNLTCNTTCGF